MRNFSFFLFATFTGFCFADNPGNLIFTQVLFRHGARAPSERLTNPEYLAHFPRGLGELTDRGFENSHLLGKFLKKRYVETGFLDKDLKPQQMYWRSVNKNRCLSSASTVGSAMFEDSHRHLHVAVSTEEFRERLLSYDQNNCPREKELLERACPDFNGNFHPWPIFEEFIANCLNYTHPVLQTYPFRTLEAYINEYKNGMPLPPPIAQHINEIMGIYVNVTQFITGTGNHHNPDMMKVKFGWLMKNLLTNLDEAVQDHQKGERSEKFVVYSTQDWILMGVLDSFGVLDRTVGLEVYPEYNSMIIIELYANSARNYSVKLLYKAEEITNEKHQLKDVTGFVRNCPADQEACPIEKFINCCTNYVVSGPDEGCFGTDTTNGVTDIEDVDSDSHVDEPTIVERRSARTRRSKATDKMVKQVLAGPE